MSALGLSSRDDRTSPWCLRRVPGLRDLPAWDLVRRGERERVPPDDMCPRSRRVRICSGPRHRPMHGVPRGHMVRGRMEHRVQPYGVSTRPCCGRARLSERDSALWPMPRRLMVGGWTGERMPTNAVSKWPLRHPQGRERRRLALHGPCLPVAYLSRSLRGGGSGDPRGGCGRPCGHQYGRHTR